MSHSDEHEGSSATSSNRHGKRTGSVEASGASASAEPVSLVHNLWIFVREVVIVVVLAVVLSLIVKTFLVQSFWIPSASMNNTLVKDDRVMVSLLTPGPFDLDRGDIVVFQDPGGWVAENVPAPQQSGIAEAFSNGLAWIGLLPNDEGNHLIKRVIGLPGDHVQCTAEGKVEVNGRTIDEPYLHPGDPACDPKDPNTGGRPFDVHVPEGKVWVMGDHRSDSADSRAHDGPSNNGTNGSVPIDDVVGRAFAVVWPLHNLTWLGEPENTFASVPAPTAVGAPKNVATTGTP